MGATNLYSDKNILIGYLDNLFVLVLDTYSIDAEA
jgi:hypothetical protein